MNNYQTHAMREFKAAGWTDADGKVKDEMQQAMCDHVLKLLDAFGDEGHSGSSAPYAVEIFSKLALFKPISPLTGEDWEWHEVDPGMFQNIRASHVFKENGEAYDVNGRIFREPNGVCYTGKGSRVAVTFPYSPKREYVDVPAPTGSD